MVISNLFHLSIISTKFSKVAPLRNEDRYAIIAFFIWIANNYLTFIKRGDTRMNSKLKQLLSLLFMACLIILTGYFILKDQSMATLLETIESVNPLYLLLGLFMMFTFVRPLIPSLFCEHLDKKFLILNVLALPSLAFTLAQLPRLPQGANPLKCFI